jgi:hypothetical protein
MMSRNSAEWRYSLGTGRKKCTPRLLMPRMSLGGSRPMGSSMRCGAAERGAREQQRQGNRGVKGMRRGSR